MDVEAEDKREDWGLKSAARAFKHRAGEPSEQCGDSEVAISTKVNRARTALASPDDRTRQPSDFKWHGIVAKNGQIAYREAATVIWQGFAIVEEGATYQLSSVKALRDKFLSFCYSPVWSRSFLASGWSRRAGSFSRSAFFKCTTIQYHTR